MRAGSFLTRRAILPALHRAARRSGWRLPGVRSELPGARWDGSGARCRPRRVRCRFPGAPDFSLTRSKHTHQPIMAKTSYLNNSDDGFAHQLQTFASAIGAYAAGLGVTPAQVTAQAADADYFSYVLQCQEIVQNASKQWTAWKDIQRRGGNVPPTGVPVVPTFPAAVTPVAPGIEVRFRALVKQIKASADYNESIGQALGIEGSPQVGPDYATLAPVLGLSMSGDRVNIDWGWQGYSAFLRPVRTPGRPRRRQGHGPARHRHDPGLYRHARFSQHPGKVELSSHLPRKRRPRRPMEQPREYHGGRGIGRTQQHGGR